jgi:GntR family transcriptional regulator / MocR family aminotransferase
VRVEWAGLGPDLLVRVDRDRPEPLGAQLQRELREAVRSGRLPPGERLPSSRVLARELGLSRNLVLECYLQLEAEGFLTARPGSGTRVAPHAQAAAEPAPPSPPAAAAPDGSPLDVDFCSGRPDLVAFPRQDWLWALREASRAAPADLFGYGDPRGVRELREVVAAYVRRVRGAAADADRIVVCAGFAQAVGLLVDALARRGVIRAAYEDPGDDSLSRRDASAVPVPVDDRGLVVEALAATDARLVLVTPTHQFPTGASLAPERRQALMEWAVASDGWIVEDDYDAEFRYDRVPVGALQGLAPDRVAAVGTVSKGLGPGLRLGWIVCPPDLVEAVAAEKELADRGSPALDQLALATLIESGRYDRHLRRMRGVYARKRQALVAALARYAPGVELRGLSAGIHAVARLPAGTDERAVAAAARARGIGLHPMGDHRTAEVDGAPPELVMGFGHLTESAIERGIAAVADLLAPDG